MGGWQRIGVVLAILFGVPAFLVAYSEYDSTNGYVTPSNEVSSLEGQAFWDALYEQAKREDPERYEGCIASTVQIRAPYSEYGGGYSISCDKTGDYAFSRSILWGLLPGLVVFIIGWTIGWIASGFRQY